MKVTDYTTTAATCLHDPMQPPEGTLEAWLYDHEVQGSQAMEDVLGDGVEETIAAVAYHVGEKFDFTDDVALAVVLATLELGEVLDLWEAELCTIVVDTIADGLQARDEAHADRYPIGPPMDDDERRDA